MASSSVRHPPAFCPFAKGRCDQSFAHVQETSAFFMYPSEPHTVAATIRETAKGLNAYTNKRQYITWEDLFVGGQIILCEICKALRHTRLAVADVTSLNFNVLFEIGLAVGLGVPVLPVRDPSQARDARVLEQLGLFDTLGHCNFTNSKELQKHVTSKPVTHHGRQAPGAIDITQPVFLVRSPVDSDTSLAIAGALHRGAYGFRQFDVRETPRMTVLDGLREVGASLGVVLHLLNPVRPGAEVHNGRCAFIAGLGVALERRVLLVSEGAFQQPVDYRDLVRTARDAREAGVALEQLKVLITPSWEAAKNTPIVPSAARIAQLHLGDIAAENEALSLAAYFVETPQYRDVREGNATLVIGRKGSGKSAIFYRLSALIGQSLANVVVALQPAAHQMMRLREIVGEQISAGMAAHTLSAIWKFILLQEVAINLLRKDEYRSHESAERRRAYERLSEVSGTDQKLMDMDFPERLAWFLRRLAQTGGGGSSESTQVVYQRLLGPLQSALLEYVDYVDSVWILVDNLDKGWNQGRPEPVDLAVMRALIEAAAELREHLARRQVSLHSVVFLRNDVYEHLVRETSDRGKVSVVNLQWTDEALFRRLVTQRAALNLASPPPTFEVVWPSIAEAHVLGEESFRFMLSRTLWRPRDILNFLRKAVQLAVAKGHKRCTEEDMVAAERSHSEDLLQELLLEMDATWRGGAECVFALAGQGSRLRREDAVALLTAEGRSQKDAEEAIGHMLWFGLLGFALRSGPDGGLYSHQVGHNMMTMEMRARAGEYARDVFEIHRAFRTALGASVETPGLFSG